MEIHKKTNDNSSSKQEELWTSIKSSVSSYNESSYLKTLISVIKSNTVYRLWLKILALFRRFRMLTYIATFISYLLALVGTGALLLVYISATVLFLAAFSIFMILFIALTSFDIRQSNEYLKRALCDKDIYIFFSSSNESLSSKSFFFKNALELSREDNCAVIIVTNSIFTKRGRFLSLKQERENLFIIRKYYYFSFKKRVMRSFSGKIISVF